MNDAPNQAAGSRQHDPLDALLTQARWPEPTSESAARLFDAWDVCSPASRRRNLFALPPAFIGAAAAIVLVTGTAILLHRANRALTDVFPFQNPTPPRAIVTPPHDVPPGHHVVSRPATAYERWAMLCLSSSRASHSSGVAVDRPSSPLRLIGPPDAAPGVTAQAQALVLRLARVPDATARRRTVAGWLGDGSPVLLDAVISALADPHLRPDAWAAAAHAPPPSPELLIEHFDDFHVDYRFAAARLLGRTCDAEHCRLLERMVRLNDHRREALAALLCCPDAQASQFLDQLEPNRSFNAQIRSARAQVERLCS